MKRYAFTMIELIFVIVVMGIIGKFGTEFLAQAYKSFIYTSINHTLQSNSATTVEFIAARLQHRIKDSVIARLDPADPAEAVAQVSGDNYNVLEWISTDIDGLRGNSDVANNPPNWSGIIDLDLSSKTNLKSPGTDTGKIDTLVKSLSYNDSTIADVALYFIGSNSDVLTSFGWSGALAQSGSIHPVTTHSTITDTFISSNGTDFTDIDIYEYYKLVWTANAIVMEDYNATTKMGNLVFKYDYQPWNDQTIADAKSATIMEGVSTFQFKAVGSIMKIQVCTKSEIIDGGNDGEGYSLCKEKTIF